jgi:uncharacterized protein with ATP-grasp and redox domains
MYEAELVDPSKAEDAVLVALDLLSEMYSTDACSAEVATVVHREVYNLLGTDPYVEMKASCNQVATQLLPTAEKYIEEADDRLTAAVTCAIVGNVFDFGIAGSIQDPTELNKKFDELFNDGIHVNDIDKIRKYLKKDAKILLFTDNCGEVVFDRLLCRELMTMGVHLTIVVKGEPILTDATMEDAMELGLSEVSDELLDTGAFAVGMDYEKASPELMERLENADLIFFNDTATTEIYTEREYRPINNFVSLEILMPDHQNQRILMCLTSFSVSLYNHLVLPSKSQYIYELFSRPIYKGTNWQIIYT